MNPTDSLILDASFQTDRKVTKVDIGKDTEETEKEEVERRLPRPKYK